MKKKLLLRVILFAGLLFVTSSVYQSYGQTPSTNKPVTQETVKYTCPMHSEILSDKTGKCPTCGMDLVAKKDKMKSGMMRDSTMMKKDHPKRMHDSTSMKKSHMMQDTTSMKHKKMAM